MTSMADRGTENKVKIRRQSQFEVAIFLPLSAVWIITRILLIPALWLPYRLGGRMDFAFAIDSFMKRSLFPLTELPDHQMRCPARIQLPERIPEIALTQVSRPKEAGLTEVLPREFASGRPLLLIAYRGSWCPYSRLHLADIATVARRLDELGVAVLAVSARNHHAWWWSKGVHLTFAADPDGDFFRALGVLWEPPLAHRVWGMLLPHESVFLFDRNGKLVSADVRQLSSTKTKQTFYSSAHWETNARRLVSVSDGSTIHDNSNLVR